MGFLDNITQSLNNLSQQVIAQGSNLAGTAQNRVKMMDIDRQLEKAFAELGRAYFEANRNTPAPEYADAFTKIKDLLAQNEFYKVETRRERGLVLCPKCGAEVAMGVAFCNSCGASMPPVDMTQQNVSQPYTVVRCPQCGLELPNGTSFCTSCGTNLQNVQPAPPAMPLGMLNMTGGSLSTPMSTQQPMPTQQPAPMPTPMSTQQPVPMPTPMPMQQPVPMPTPMPTQQPVPMPTPMPTQNPVPMPTPTIAKPTGVSIAKAPVAPAPTGFPNGSPAPISMDIDSKTIYGDTAAPTNPHGGITLEKK